MEIADFLKSLFMYDRTSIFRISDHYLLFFGGSIVGAH